jgi:hypothetical protein
VEDLGIIIVVAAAVGVAVWLHGRNTGLTRRTLNTVIGLIVGGGAAAAVVYGFQSPSGSRDDARADQALAEARSLPLVGLVLDDIPGAEARLRKALRDEIRNPTTQGPPRPLAVMSELRATYIVPALKASDDADAASVLAIRNTLMHHLRSVDLATCRELALTGIQRGDKLDERGQKLMRDLLAAIEKAYRSGRAAIANSSAATRPVPADSEVGKLLTEAGLTTADFDKLQKLTRLSNEEACDLAIKLNEAPSKLPADKSGPLARYLAAAQ